MSEQGTVSTLEKDESPAPVDEAVGKITEQHFVPPGDRISTKSKFAYSMGVVSDHYAQFAIHSFLMPFFNVVLGLRPTTIASAMGLARLWDAISDPLVGTISDRTKSRWGRRRPFLFVGAIVTGVLFPLIWLVPPTWSQGAITAWLIVALLLYYSAFTLYAVPYESLGMELTADYQERTNLFTFRTYVYKLFDLGINWLLPLATAIAAWLAARQLLGENLAAGDAGYQPRLDLLTQENLLRTIPWVSAGVGVVIIGLGVLPAFWCKERFAKIAHSQPGENPLRSMLSVMRDLPFVTCIGTMALYLLSVNASGVLGFYVSTYYIYDGDIKSGAMLGGYHATVGLIFSFVGAFVIGKLARRFDKKPLLVGCVAVILLCSALMSVTYLRGHPYLTLATRPLRAIAETGFWVLAISMRADLGDWEEYKSGRRREGVIAAMGNWIVKLAITLAAIIGGVLLEHVCGFDAALKNNQAPETLSKLKWAFVLAETIPLLIALGLVMLYPLTRDQLMRVRVELEMRRGKV